MRISYGLYEALDSLDKLYESSKTLRRELSTDLKYLSLEDLMNKDDVMFNVVKTDPEQIRQAYNNKNCISANDWIVIPKGTKVTYVRTFNDGKYTYDLFHLIGEKNALFAVDVDFVDEVFVDIL